MPPRFEMPVPATGIFDSPTVNFCINSEWASFVDGCLQPLLNLDIWTGDYDTQQAAVDQIQELLIKLGTLEECFTMPVGATMIWHTDTPPDRWLICDGSGYLKSAYPQLYALWGAKYGESPTFFGTPNLRSRLPYGADFDIELDEAFGAATHTLATTELPSHTHGTRIVSSGAAGANNALVVTQANVTTTPTINTSNGTGGGAAHNNMPPVRGVNFIVYAGL